MQSGNSSDEVEHERPLTTQERELARWMLEHANTNASRFLQQLDKAVGTSWRCGCGCASFSFRIQGLPKPAPGINVIADYVWGTSDDLKCVFIFEKKGILSGVEVLSYGGHAPTQLPCISELRKLDTSA